MFTIEECEAWGGHQPIPQMGGMSAAHVIYWEACRRCPAVREGMKSLTSSDSEVIWTEWDKWGPGLMPIDYHHD